MSIPTISHMESTGSHKNISCAVGKCLAAVAMTKIAQSV